MRFGATTGGERSIGKEKLQIDQESKHNLDRQTIAANWPFIPPILSQLNDIKNFRWLSQV